MNLTGPFPAWAALSPMEERLPGSCSTDECGEQTGRPGWREGAQVLGRQGGSPGQGLRWSDPETRAQQD